MKHFFPNSKTAVVQLHSKFEGTLTEVDKIADDINQYGNIVSYELQKHDNRVDVIFKLAEDYNKFKK